MLLYIRTLIVYIKLTYNVWNTQIYNAIKRRSLYFVEIYYLLSMIATLRAKSEMTRCINDRASTLPTQCYDQSFSFLASTEFSLLFKSFVLRLGQPFMLCIVYIYTGIHTLVLLSRDFSLVYIIRRVFLIIVVTRSSSDS